MVFQSTLPVGEATGLEYVTAADTALDISIHASRGGSDESVISFFPHPVYFNPRFPWGKRQRKVLNTMRQIFISIHASRGGSDGQRIEAVKCPVDFNPRFPWGKRRTA